MADEFPDFWKSASGCLDFSLRECYLAARESPLKLICFLKKHRLALSLYAEPDDVDKAIAIAPNFHTEPEVISRLMSVSTTMKAMFKSCWLVCARTNYITEVKRQLVVLEKEDFRPDYTERFLIIISQEADKLRAEGHKRCKNMFDGEVALCSAEHIPMTYDYAGDEGEMLFWSRVKTILCNSRQKPAFPWLELFWEKGSFELAPETLVIDEAVLKPVEELWALTLELFQDRPSSLEHMTKTLRKNFDYLCSYHRSIKIDMAFLDHVAPKLLVDKVTEALMACFTLAEGVDVDFGAVAAKLQKVRWGNLVGAMSDLQQEEIAGVVTHVDNLANGFGPKDITSHSALTRKIFDKALSKVHVQVTDKKKLPVLYEVNKKAKGPWVLFGTMAIRELFKRTEERFWGNDPTLQLTDFKVFKRFNWIFTPEERMRMQIWTQKITEILLGVPKKCLKAPDSPQQDEDEDEGDDQPTFGEPCIAEGATSSSSTGVTAGEVLTAKQNDPSKDAENMKKMKDGIARFFKPQKA